MGLVHASSYTEVVTAGHTVYQRILNGKYENYENMEVRPASVPRACATKAPLLCGHDTPNAAGCTAHRRSDETQLHVPAQRIIPCCAGLPFRVPSSSRQAVQSPPPKCVEGAQPRVWSAGQVAGGAGGQADRVSRSE